MKILIVGGGGREHALAFAIKKSPLCDELFCAPGNAGTAQIAHNIDIRDSDINSIVSFCVENKIGLVVVGPEIPLVLGLVDELGRKGIKAFGPAKNAAQIEASKSFSKYFFKKYSLPTADFEVFDNFEDAKNYINKKGAPIVVKADGLAAGKGVTVAQTDAEAIDALKAIFIDRKFGDAGNKVVIEEKLEGEEASFLAFSDGKNILPMIAAQDHKPVFDNDLGPNTGGMGAYAQAPIVDDKLKQYIIKDIIQKTIDGLREEGIVYKGVLYAGLMIKDKKPYLLEFNCRFGDPETQAILPLMDSDIVEIMLASIDGNLSSKTIKWKRKYAVCVVLASGGYPGKYDKGKIIRGLNDVRKLDNVYVFHAGTSEKNADIVTNGGRVLNVVGTDENFERAQKKSYDAIKLISFDGMQYRKDIGDKAKKYFGIKP